MLGGKEPARNQDRIRNESIRESCGSTYCGKDYRVSPYVV